jgi:broad specificity phosphatase PhoE
MGSLFLARHATTEASATGRNLGRRADPPLAPAGRDLALRLGHALWLEIDELPHAAEGDLRLISSSALRCRETMDAVATALVEGGLRPTAIEPHAELLELDYGEWDGLTAAESQQRDPAVRAAWEADPFQNRAPGGESGRDVAERAFPVLDEIQAWLAEADARCAVVVAHNHVNRVWLCRLIGWPMRDYRDRVVQDPAGYSLITFPSGRASVVRRLNAMPPVQPAGGQEPGLPL